MFFTNGTSSLRTIKLFRPRVRLIHRARDEKNLMTDQDLINKFLAGEMAAFNTLVWRWEQSIYNFVLRYLGEREAAKEICQSTFIRAYEKLHRLSDQNKLSTWLHQIAVNLCRDEVRRRQRRQTVSLSEIDHNGSCGPAAFLQSKSDPENDACQENLNDLLTAALQQIPDDQRVVIVLKTYQGLKFCEISHVLKISESTAKSRMYYGLAGLRKIFKKWQIDKESLSL